MTRDEWLYTVFLDGKIDEFKDKTAKSTPQNEGLHHASSLAAYSRCLRVFESLFDGDEDKDKIETIRHILKKEETK